MPSLILLRAIARTLLDVSYYYTYQIIAILSKPLLGTAIVKGKPITGYCHTEKQIAINCDSK
jgi:hypothetical protein